MSVGHYENFPVASVLCPKPLRWPITVVYHFARSADDIADEGDATPAQRVAALDGYLAQLAAIEANALPAQAPPLFHDVRTVIETHQVPVQLFCDLINAFKQDCVQESYADYPQVLDYCRRSANPIGRILLHLYGCATLANLPLSDAICSALQLINFWQDVAIDLKKPRRYLPDAELAQFAVSPAQLHAYASGAALDAPFVALMQFQVTRARALMLEGAPLVRVLPGRIGWELRLVVQGGLRILKKIESVQFDVFNRRPTLNAFDYAIMLVQALFMRPSIDIPEGRQSMRASSH
jgi:squalene synthase HpnC